MIMSNFSKPLPELYQSDPRLLGSGCKKYSGQRSSSSSESHVVPTPDNSKESLPPPSTFQELDAEISAFKCSSHYKTCSQGRGGCFGRNFFSESEVRATEMLQLLSVYREKTRKLNKDDLEQYVLNNIFKKHCINIDEVINQTQEERTNLFGKPIVGDNGCGEEDISDSGDSAGEDVGRALLRRMMKSPIAVIVVTFNAATYHIAVILIVSSRVRGSLVFVIHHRRTEGSSSLAKKLQLAKSKGRLWRRSLNTTGH